MKQFPCKCVRIWGHACVRIVCKALLEISFLCNFYAVPVVQSTMDLEEAAIVWHRREKRLLLCLLFYTVLGARPIACSLLLFRFFFSRFCLGVFAFVVCECGEHSVVLSFLHQLLNQYVEPSSRTLRTAWMKKDIGSMLYDSYAMLCHLIHLNKRELSLNNDLISMHHIHNIFTQ